MTPALILALALSSQADAPLFSRPNPALEAGAKALNDRDYDRAIDLYRQAEAKTAKERAVVEYNVGIAQLEKAQHLKMMEAVRKAQEAAGGQGEGEDATLDEAMADTPDFDAAIEALERAYKLSEDSHLRSQAALGVGNSYALREKYKKAIDGYRRALVQDPQNSAARNNLRTTLRRMRAQQKPPKQEGEEGDENESGDGESEEGEEGEEGQEGGESSDEGDEKESESSDDGEKKTDGEQENEGDKNGESGSSDGASGDEDREESAADDGKGGDQKEREGDEKNEQNDKDERASGDDKKEEEAGEDGKGSNSKDGDDDKKEDKEKTAGDNADDEDQKDLEQKKKDAEKEAQEGGEKPKPNEEEGEESPKEDPLKAGQDDKDPSQKDPKKKGQAKDKPGQNGAGGTAKDTPKESLEKQRARAILDALRRRERPLGPVMMNPQPAPRRKVKKDW